MELEDPNLNNFLDTVCQYMETWYSSDDERNNFSLDEICEEPHSEFKKLLQVLHRALSPLHKDWFDNFFTPDTIEWNYVYSLLSTHCFALVNRYKSQRIFICLMYICNFTYSLLDYCDRKGLTGRLRQIKWLIKEAFHKHIKDRFMFKGGWSGLKVYCQREHLPKMIELISDCYCEVKIFHTYVLNNQKVYNFGIHDKETIASFLSNVQAFENAVLDAFKYDMYVSPNYEQEVRRAFSQLRSNLENAPTCNYLSSCMSQLTVHPPSPLFTIYDRSSNNK